MFDRPSQPLCTLEKGMDIINVTAQFLRTPLKSLYLLMPYLRRPGPQTQKAATRKC
ncbi:hypothetical protein AGABI1DRAFT_115674 [Agaricus bisporus var. burnettii JB137-S8]|uniref:Uncharacterized protein n=1 Tax=Agaricus bisporus var. burnettii (strain JB137-S8 / ATCC MYA-4627 / FGSC 10392) TaxID=597362 RepID=K5X0B2_AGABU|nr:uncharacterized protein AGABI1DRAFT_115674 [Agaricus bisporus var. burnettii JB137-S8]EKM76548.1 hypothetical protein AGABI1DRAFT_115674 [Agaricus bisporus var. burnettii JB137-S8]